MAVTSKPTAIDLFCGCGGMTCGLKMAGFRVLGAVDNNPLAVKTYRQNHPEVHVWETDIRTLSVADVKEKLSLAEGQLDLVAGCPPCQGFSSLRTLNGNRAIEDDRNNLILEFLRFIRGLKPRFVMMENVPAMGKDWRYVEFREELESLGYRCLQDVLDVANFGVPQRRRRFVFIAGLRCEVAFPEPDKSRVTVRSAIGALPAPSPETGCDPLHDYREHRSKRVMDLIRAIPKNGGSRKALGPDRQLTCHKHCDGFKDVYGRMRWDDVSPTITSGCTNPSKGRFLHPEQDRAITLREAALLQSFPPDYKFSLERGRSGVATLIGNALPPEFVRRQAKVLYELALTQRENHSEGDDRYFTR